MGRHSAVRRSHLSIMLLALLGATTITTGAVAFAVWWSGDDGSPPPPRVVAPALTPTVESAGTPVAKCGTTVRVVTAASFAPVLKGLAAQLAPGKDCARLAVTVADGRPGAKRAAKLGADVWIPDDPAWAVVAGREDAEGPVVATSPVYFVTDTGTAAQVKAAGGSWLGLAKLVDAGKGVKPVVRDPAGSGDGLIAAGALGESVWLTSGMDASAESLANAVQVTRTVTGTAAARPRGAGEVGLVPEYVLAQRGWPAGQVVLAPTDHTAQLRYTWLPAKAKSQKVAKAMARVLRTLRSAEAGPQLAAAGLRGADGVATQGIETRRLPEVTAKPFGVLEPHHVDHVFATWYPGDRRSDVLVVVDVSGSMAAPAPGSSTPLIRLVARGCARLGALLPDDSRLALWEFGSDLDPPRDYRTLLRPGLLTAAHRQDLVTATEALRARPTGTGLYDTVLAAYLSARDSYRAGLPNQVVLFTDGRNQDDPGSMTAQQLTRQLKQAADPKRPVQLAVISFGKDQDAGQLEKILEPVEGYVEPLANASQVDAMFIHVAAGGLQH